MKQANVFKRFHPILFHHAYKHALKILALFQSKRPDYLELMSEPPDSFEGLRLGDKIERCWQAEAAKPKRGPKCLLWLLFKATCVEWTLGLALNLIIRGLCMLLTFNYIGQIVTQVEELTGVMYAIDSNSSDSNNPPGNETKLPEISSEQTPEQLYRQLLVTVCTLLFVVIVYMVSFSYLKLERIARGIRARVALSQLIFRKSQKLDLETSIRQSSSAAIDLISNEMTVLEEAIGNVVSIIYGPVILFGGTLWLAYSFCGLIPILATYVVMLIPIAFEFYVPIVYGRLIKNRTIETKQRIEVTGAFMNSVKVAKMYNWERVFRQMIDSIRAREMAWYRKLDLLYVSEMLTIGFCMKLLPAVMYMFHIWIYGELSAVVLIVGSTGYQYFVSEGLGSTMRGSKAYKDLAGSCAKIQAYLLLAEKKKDSRRNSRACDQRTSSADIFCDKLVLAYSTSGHGDEQEESLVGSRRESGASTDKTRGSKRSRRIENYMLALKSASNNNPKLSAVNCNIIEGLTIHLKQGQLVMVIGQVGAGKSTLLLSLLGELPPRAGQIVLATGTTMAYAAQEPWILSDTIRNNILLGREFKPQRYRQVVEVCSLSRDLSLLPNGDETFVGSKGVSLSGGQKARVNLARAVYSEADVYLLDDPLSAVDSKVSKHLFGKCFKKFLAGKLIVLATHQRQYLRQADQVVALERGRPPRIGTPAEMLKTCEQLLSKELEPASGTGLTEEVAAPGAGEAEPELEQEFEAADEAATERLRDLVGLNRPLDNSYLVLLKMGFTRTSILVTLAAYVVYTPLNAFIDYFIRIWRNQIVADSQNPSLSQAEFTRNLFLGCATFLGMSVIGSTLLSVFQLQIFAGLRRASKNLHKKLLNTLFAAKMSFYDFCPPGNLGARYAADFIQIDHILKQMLLNVVQISSWIIGFILMLAIMQPISGLFYLIICLLFGPKFLADYRTLIQLVNLNKHLRAPLYTQIAPVVDEIDTLRSNPSYLAYVDRKFRICQNKLTTMSLLTILYESRLTTLIKLPIMLVTLASYYVIFIYDRDLLEAAKTGVFIMMMSTANFFLPIMIEMYSTTDSCMRSVDSVQQLFYLEPEQDSAAEVAGKHSGNSQAEIAQQPLSFSSGRIEFKNVSLRYFEDEKAVLSELSFVIEAGQQVGVVGRTGAGKSSIVSLLFRLYPFEGSIEIDGICSKQLTLAQLRASLGVIPQDPVLFSDSLRKNLDPFGNYPDEELWRALEVVELKKHVYGNLPEGLDHKISEGGRNFSMGQRQLVCLARAVLKSPKVLIMDEATANVDQDTDLLIQRTIKRHFAGSTVVTIAHRLNTILDYDKVLVLDAGKIVEFDTVERLLNKEGGLFRAMLASSAPATATTTGTAASDASKD